MSDGTAKQPEPVTGRHVLGNMAKIREALESICARASIGGEFDPQAYLDEIHEIAQAALSAPERNCDVGTAWEQADRFKEFCKSNSVFYRDMFGHDDEGRLDGWDCKKECPVGLIVDEHECLLDHCELVWAQMPYREPAKEGGEA